MKNFKLHAISLLSVATLFYGANSFADIIVNSSVGGLGTFKDTSTGYTWLRLDNFFNQSVNQQLLEANNAGFTWATSTEVERLLSSIDISSESKWDLVAAITGRAPNRELIWGAYSQANNTHGWAYSYKSSSWIYDASSYSNDVIQNGDSPYADLNLWAFLLRFGPSAEDTLTSMQSNASAMRGVFSLQASYVNPGLSYDCSIFNEKGICFSMTARNTSVSSSGIDSSSGVATVSYRVNPNIRIGGFVEQMTSSIKEGGVRLDNNSPDYGLFGVWQENENGEGLKFRTAYRYGNKDLEVTRQALGTAEAGFGKTELTTQGVQFTASNGFLVQDKVLLSPYAGLRYIKIKRDGYTEELSATVTTPLTYDNLTQETTSALLGAHIAVQVTPQVTATGSLGIEHDIARKVSNYSATGVDNLESIKFNNDSKRTRAVASVSLAYRINQTQQIGAQVVYREEAYGDKSTTTGMLTYTAGF